MTKDPWDIPPPDVRGLSKEAALAAIEAWSAARTWAWINAGALDDEALQWMRERLRENGKAGK